MEIRNEGKEQETVVGKLLDRSGNAAEMIERAKQARQLGIELRKAKGHRLNTGEFSKWQARQ